MNNTDNLLLSAADYTLYLLYFNRWEKDGQVSREVN